MSDLEHDAYVYPGQRIARNGAVLGHGQGMTLRDWFAGQAEPLDRTVNNDTLSTLIGMELPDGLVKGALEHWRIWAKADAAWRYIQADAMIAARQGGEQ